MIQDDVMQRLKKFLSILPILPMIMLIILSGKWLLAEIYHYQANAYMALWDSSSPIPNSEWEIARKALTKALALGLNQPVYLEDMSDLFYLKSITEPIDPILSIELQKQTLEFIRQAIRLRPSWPYAWAKLANIKYYTFGMDAEVADALDKAMILGAWEPMVQLTVAKIGMASWKKLPNHLQDKVIVTMARTVQTESNEVLVIVKNLDMIVVFCERMRLLGKFKKDCR